MKIKILSILVFALILTIFGFLISKEKEKNTSQDQCLSCHSDLSDNLQVPAKAYTKDIHYLKGVTCAGCHGGDASTDDMDESMNKQKGFLGDLKGPDRYKACVKCHSDEKQMKKYNSSIPTNQFENLKFSVHASSSDKLYFIADCITCHSVHDIAAVKDPMSTVYTTKIPALCGSCHSNPSYMKKYNPKLPTDQVAKYNTSVHGQKIAQGDVNVAECVSCHGNHGIKPVKDPKSSVYPLNIPQVCSKCHSDTVRMAKYHIPTNQYTLFTTSVHGKALLEKQDLNAPSCNSCHGNHGATPPDVESISNVCGTCHSLNADLFSKSPHKKAFDSLNVPECETCHGNHGIQPVSDNMLGVQEKSVCIKCHKDGDNGYIAAKLMKEMIDSLKFKDSTVIRILNEATEKGLDVSDAVFSMKDLKQIFIQTTTNVHLVSMKDFKETIQPGYDLVNKSDKIGIAAIHDFYFRREGLGILTIIVTILVVALYFKIKKIEKNKKV